MMDSIGKLTVYNKNVFYQHAGARWMKIYTLLGI
jgi:hypothetical protein